MKKKTVVGLAALALVCILSAGMTLAYFSSRDTANNVITMGKVEGILTETDEIERADETTGLDYDNIKPGQEIAKDPKITLDADSEKAYARIRLSYRNLSDEEVTQLEELLVLNQGWSRGTDGYYYYNEVLDAAQESTSSTTVFEKVTIPSQWGNETAGRTFHMDITAELVQADYFTPERDVAGNIVSWGSITIGD